jgi:spore coat protein H
MHERTTWLAWSWARPVALLAVLGCSRQALDMPGSASESALVAAEPTSGTGPVGPPESIFERERVVEVQVEMSPEDWKVLRVEGIGMREILFPESGYRKAPAYTRFTGSVTVNGVRYENVSIRKKGFVGSLSVSRPSLKFDFSRNFDLPLAGGMRRMTLNNDLSDQTHVRQCLTYDLFTEIGLPAPRCNYAHVVVNGVDLGTYSHVENVAKPMLARHFADNGGNLYEGTLADFNAGTAAHLELETNEKKNDRSDVQAVIAALAASDDEVVAALGRVVALDQFFDFWALETLLGHSDGYSRHANNYYAYHDPTTDKFFFIPWGADATFKGDVPNAPSPSDVPIVYAGGAIAGRLYALPEQRARYRARLAQLNDQLWQVPSLLGRVEASSRLAPNPSRPELTRLRSHIRNHAELLREALLRPAPDAPPPEPRLFDDACAGKAGALAGSFVTQWGKVDDLDKLAADGSSRFDVSLEIDGAPPRDSYRGRAGEGKPNRAKIRMLGARGDGWSVLVDLGMPQELFEPGHHPFHGWESSGEVRLYHPRFSEPFDAPFFVGFIGDGAVQLDEVNLAPGGTVSGSFHGIVNRYTCTESLVRSFAGVDGSRPPAK